MCQLCLKKSQDRFRSRRQFLKGAAAVGLGTLGMNLFSARRAMAADPPTEAGRHGMRYVIRGGSVMSIGYWVMPCLRHSWPSGSSR